MRIYELQAVLAAFPDDTAEVVITLDGKPGTVTHIVRMLEGQIVIAAAAAPVLDS